MDAETRAEIERLRRLMEEGTLMAPRMSMEDRKEYILNVLMTKVRSVQLMLFIVCESLCAYHPLPLGLTLHVHVFIIYSFFSAFCFFFYWAGIIPYFLYCRHRSSQHVIRASRSVIDPSTDIEEDVKRPSGGKIGDSVDGDADGDDTSKGDVVIPERGNTETESNEGGSDRVCAICLAEYEDGEEISWSHNRHCKHFFHRSCIAEWLLFHDQCPCCRLDFLSFNDEEDEQGRPVPVSAPFRFNYDSDDDNQAFTRGLQLFLQFANAYYPSRPVWANPPPVGAASGGGGSRGVEMSPVTRIAQSPPRLTSDPVDLSNPMNVVDAPGSVEQNVNVSPNINIPVLPTEDISVTPSRDRRQPQQEELVADRSLVSEVDNHRREEASSPSENVSNVQL